ncbi:MAG TPA: hypothetical protein P5307_00895 [Pirellulaceae bacterium]|nr:hypothetical protein [Planctomycetales bacterium]MCB9940055.1 hypothetical protein [Planctomycetaceae bacterium]HRX77580.1 hypothetical protein [Pirellulaceae bacterium]
MSTPTRLVLNEADLQSVGNRQVTINILTDGLEPPLATLDTNLGYPAIRDLYATARSIMTAPGVARGHIVLTMRFENPVPATANKLAVTLYQKDATSYTFP